MAQHLHDPTVTGSSTEISVTEPPTGIPDDIFQAALVASQHDSDGEDPYEPQPKRFIQTEHQKRQQKRDLEIRRLAWTMRKQRHSPLQQLRLMQTGHQKRQRKLHLETSRLARTMRKQRHSPFQQLPTELILKLMQHTNLRELVDLFNSSAINKSIFKANENAVFRGIEMEQFREWRWLFGDSTHRTSAQSQHLKDAILSHNQSDKAYGWAYDEQLLDILRLIDNSEFTGVRNVMFLQDMQDLVDLDITAINSYTSMNIARRTAMCLRSLSFQRPGIVDKQERTEFGPLVSALLLPWEARSHLVNEQPEFIQAEIRSILKIVVEDLSYFVQRVLTQWAFKYYTVGGGQRKRQEVKGWMSKIVTGLILETVIPWWPAELGASRDPFFTWTSASVYLSHALRKVLTRHDAGIKEGIQAVRDGVDFGQKIGMNMERLFDGPVQSLFSLALDMYGDE